MTLETIDLSNGTARRLLSNEEMKEFLWLPQGRILYTACRPDIHGFSCNYWEMRVNPDTGEPLGGQRPLTQWAGFYMANTGATATCHARRAATIQENRQTNRLRISGTLRRRSRALTKCRYSYNTRA